jgi:hypothetical protein
LSNITYQQWKENGIELLFDKGGSDESMDYFRQSLSVIVIYAGQKFQIGIEDIETLTILKR